MRIALALPVEIERRIIAEAEHHGHEIVATTTGADELTHNLGGAGSAIVLSAARYLSPDLMAACDLGGVRVVALVADDAGRRHAASVGLFETADATADWSAIERLLAAPEAAPAAGRAVGRGAVMAVWGPAGAPGRTSVAICLAAELAAAGRIVALADVDTHAASVAPALGLPDESPGFAAACRLAGSDSLTRQELERVAQRYESAGGAFWVLTGIGRPSRWPEITGERVAATIEACRSWVDYTVLDTSAGLEEERDAGTLAALRGADRVVAVGSADPVGLSRFLRGYAELVEVVESRDITVVMNRVRASAIGLNPAAQVSLALARFGGLDRPVLIPHDLAGFDGAVLRGKALPDVAPRSPARMALHDLAAFIAPPPDTRRRRKGK